MLYKYNNVHKRLIALFAIVLTSFSVVSAASLVSKEEIMKSAPSEMKDTVDTTNLITKKKSTFMQKVLKPFKWFGQNWSAYDPRYSTPSFYMWVGQFQNTFSNEWLDIKYPDNNEIKMHSKLSSKIGPQLGYSFLMYGYTLDLFALKGTKRRTEFTLSINSNLLNADIIYRRTGGDFVMSKLKTGVYSEADKGITPLDVTDIANMHNVGDLMKYDVTGLNINYFTNHKKYSNPAAFSNGAIQLRSVGSPILGIGYTHHKLGSSVCDVIETSAFNSVFNELSKQPDVLNGMLNNLSNRYNTSITDLSSLRHFMIDTYESGNIATYKKFTSDIFNNPLVQPLIFGKMVYDDGNNVTNITNTEVFSQLLNDLPSTTTIKDLHLQMGYAYNLVFSRRLLLGLSVIASPSVKWIRYDNNRNLSNIAAEELASAMNKYFDVVDVSPDIFRSNGKYTQLGVNAFGRASLTYNFNRWRAGFNANASAYLLKSDDMSINNIYGSVNVYVGYCFGRKKQYRWNGKDREAYITAALTKRQIEEMKDTMPQSNIDNGASYLNEYGNTRYKSDKFNFEIIGCDLVKGPEGEYGMFEIQDGLITAGQDTEGRLRPGTVLYMDKDGSLTVTAGHKPNFLPANWWKSQLTLRQTPTNWYPEMLHYGLKGKLTLYVRSHTFGTKKPVKVEIENFCINHGVETKQFFQIGAQDFYSHSSYSIIGTADVNNRLCRVYIESKKRGTKNYVYINRMKASGSKWMKYIPDDRAISRISIPGTHDAGTASLPENNLTSMGHTQNFTITEQLYDGIRAFDIRLKKNMKYGHTMTCRDGIDETLVDIRKFLADNPSEFLVAMIGSDEGGKWGAEMIDNFNKLMNQYKDILVEDFDAKTPISQVRGKVLVIRRQEDCPYGKLLKFEDNAIFDYDCFKVEDVYKQHKTYKKIKLVEKHLRDAYENDDPTKWYISFNSIAWDPRHHKPYYSAWGAVNVRKPMNKALREVIETKGYSNFGMVFLDFYNDHGDKPQLVEAIINSNFHVDTEQDYIPVDPTLK